MQPDGFDSCIWLSKSARVSLGLVRPACVAEKQRFHFVDSAQFFDVHLQAFHASAPAKV
jgi:hypothetical protein